MIVMDSVAIYYATWLLAVVSLVGTYLNIKKQKACFIIWGVTNALWVLYDFSIGAIAQAALMLCSFCSLCMVSTSGEKEQRQAI